MAVRYPITCPNCGHTNTEGMFCAHCGAQLAPTGQIDTGKKLPARPFWITLYAAFMIVVGILITVGAITYPGTGELTWILSIVLLVYFTLTAVGLWKQQNWARLSVIMGMGILFAFGLLALLLVSGTTAPLNRWILYGWWVGLIVAGFTVWWYIRSYQYFE
jgi:hypothetical protein